MTVDNLIEELTLLKQTYPEAGRLKVFRVSKNRNNKELISVNRKCFEESNVDQGVRLQFERIW